MDDTRQETAQSLRVRLAAAIQRWGGTRAVAAFCRAMEQRGVRGATRTAVHELLRGKHSPSLEFVTHAGDVLGVRPAWLAWGEPPVTPQEARLAAEIVRHAIIASEAAETLVQVRAQVGDELNLNGGGDYDGDA
jgi:hypothetical protein